MSTDSGIEMKLQPNSIESKSKRKSRFYRATSIYFNNSEDSEISIDSTLTPPTPTIDIVLVFKEHLLDSSLPDVASTPTKQNNPLASVTTATTTNTANIVNIVKGRKVIDSDGNTISFQTILNRIHHAGLYTVEIRSHKKWSAKNDTGYVYLGIGATERRLIMCADDIKYKLLGNPIEMKRMAESGRPGVWEPIYTLHRDNWEIAKYPSIEDNPVFEEQMEKQVYNEMKTKYLPSIQKFRTEGWDSTVSPSMNPFQCIYLPVETFSLCQKPGLNKENVTERTEKHVRLVCPPSTSIAYLRDQDPRREYHFDLYARVSDTGSLFRSTDRQRLVTAILVDHIEDKQFGISQGAGLDLPYLVRHKVIKDVYCLHDDIKRAELLKRWGGISTCCICCERKKSMHEFGAKYNHRQTSQNLWLLRNYFGETVAMYFGFVEYLIRSTYHLSIIGIGMFIWQLVAFFAEIERRNIAGFKLATNATNEAALEALTENCALWKYTERMGQARVSSALCPSEYFNLTSSLLWYNNTHPNITIFQTVQEAVNYTRTFENEWKFNSTAMLPFLAFFTWAFSLLVVVFWRRRQKRYALEWGTNGCESDESLRWSYKSNAHTHEHIDPITGSVSYIMYPCRRLRILCHTRAVIGVLLLTVFTGVVSVVILRAALTSSLASDELQQWAGVICGVANSVWITIMQIIWQNVSVRLNDAENYSTNTEWEDALTLKTFIFSFVNNYAGCFFIMFVQVHHGIAQDWLGSSDEFVFGQCGQKNGGCMRVLGVNLVIVFISKLIFGNLTEVITICLGSKNTFTSFVGNGEQRNLEDDDGDGVNDVEAMANDKSGVVEGDDAIHQLHPMERDHLLPKYTTFSRIYDYLEVVILFGFTVFFVLAWPAACLLPICLLAWQLELVIDSTKICTGHRKSLPMKAEDIGVWEDIMAFMSLIALISNAYQLCYVAKFDYALGFELNDTQRIWAFWCIMLGGYIFWVAVQRIVPATPSDVSLQIQRSEHLATKLVYNRPDENFEAEHAARHDDLSNAEGEELVDKIFQNFFPKGADRPGKELFGIHKEVHEDVHHLLSTILSHHLSPPNK